MHLKKRKILAGILLFILILTTACKTQIEEKTKEGTQGTPKKTLSDLQTIACNTADNAGTCASRLVDVGIVSPEQCCEILQKCC